MPIAYILGQTFGLVSTVSSIIMPLFKKKWQMLVNDITINVLTALNFVLIGETGAAAGLCTVGAIQGIIALVHTWKETRVTRLETWTFGALFLGVGLFTMVTAPGFRWELSLRNLVELLPIAGSLLSMSFVFIRDEQKARCFLLAACIAWFTYSGIVGAAAFFSQLVSAGTAAASIYKYRKKKT